ncbi:MAG: hydroxymethylglutaryl-CoA reductase [Saprospiraceae bacterium]
MKDKAGGFSKLDKTQKIEWVQENILENGPKLSDILAPFQHQDPEIQKILNGFSENTLCNFPMPYGIAPHFVINGEGYAVPMVIEESSVVAAASNAAKFWKTRGGIKAQVLNTVKLGHIYFFWHGIVDNLSLFFSIKKKELQQECADFTANMKSRGGGICSMELIDMTSAEEGFYKIEIKFNTCDSMGANFINTVLEKVAIKWKFLVEKAPQFLGDEKKMEIMMCILSNYTPDCVVRVEVGCNIDKLGKFPNGLSAKEFANKFYKAVKIAKIDPYRATTHNKGIFNGMDAIVLATGNDFRAIEACGHTYAVIDGQYRGLSTCTIDNNYFRLFMEIPLALGTVGGLTNLHPLAKLSLRILKNPNASKLMEIVASVGLMQNFAAIRSLITTGIQKGHMRMHLSNILNQLHATEKEFVITMEYFADNLVSFSSVREYIHQLRKLGVSD